MVSITLKIIWGLLTILSIILIGIMAFSFIERAEKETESKLFFFDYFCAFLLLIATVNIVISITVICG